MYTVTVRFEEGIEDVHNIHKFSSAVDCYAHYCQVEPDAKIELVDVDRAELIACHY